MKKWAISLFVLLVVLLIFGIFGYQHFMQKRELQLYKTLLSLKRQFDKEATQFSLTPVGISKAKIGLKNLHRKVSDLNPRSQELSEAKKNFKTGLAGYLKYLSYLESRTKTMTSVQFQVLDNARSRMSLVDLYLAIYNARYIKKIKADWELEDHIPFFTDIPRYPNSVLGLWIDMSEILMQEKGRYLDIKYETNDSFGKIKDYFKKEMKRRGWEESRPLEFRKRDNAISVQIEIKKAYPPYPRKTVIEYRIRSKKSIRAIEESFESKPIPRRKQQPTEVTPLP